MNLLRLLGRSEPGDGAAGALETAVTGISPAFMDAASEAGSAPRRARAADPGNVMVTGTVAAKVLHGWLQNRHQTLLPLSFNLRVLLPAQRRTIACALVALLRVGRGRGEADLALPGLAGRLQALGADPDMLALVTAESEPPPLGTLLDDALTDDVAVHVYLAALLASDPRFPASMLLCDVVQARFDLSTAVARTAMRRYRR